jgi:NPCBM/NEW2 domain
MGSASRWITGIALMVMFGACNTTPDATPSPNPYANGAQYPWEDTSLTAQAAPPLNTGYLSDQQWAYATNGWGPIEKDRSNGEQNAGDGGTISLNARTNGRTYERGLGVHANGRIRYTLAGQCQNFTAIIGLDDEIRHQNQFGSVTMEVWADGVRLYDSGLITQSTPNKTLNVDISGRSELTLMVNQANENNWFDHADWADAHVSCGGGTPGPLPNQRYLSDLAPMSAQNVWGPIESDTSNGENLPGDGRTISIRGQKYARGVGVHAYSELHYDLNAQCSRLTAVVGVDDEVNGMGSVQFRVHTDTNAVLFDSGVMSGSSPAKTMDVDVSGGHTLILVVENGGDGGNYDHADWADAKLTCAGPAFPPNLWPGTQTLNYRSGNLLQLAVDSTGAFYVGGQILNPGLTDQLFVTKYDTRGTLVWTRQFGDLPSNGNPAQCSTSTSFSMIEANASSVVVLWHKTLRCSPHVASEDWYATRLSSGDGELVAPAALIERDVQIGNHFPRFVQLGSLRLAQDGTAAFLGGPLSLENRQQVYILSATNAVRTVPAITSSPDVDWVDFAEGNAGEKALVVARTDARGNTLERWTLDGVKLSSNTFETPGSDHVVSLVVGPYDRHVYASTAHVLYAFNAYDGIQRWRISGFVYPHGLSPSPQDGVLTGNDYGGLSQYTSTGVLSGELGVPFAGSSLWSMYPNGSFIVFIVVTLTSDQTHYTVDKYLSDGTKL